MSNSEKTDIVGAVAALIVLVAYGLLILRPAWMSYSRVWERFAAVFLSLYILAAFAGLGVGGGLAIVWFWDRIQG